MRIDPVGPRLSGMLLLILVSCAEPLEPGLEGAPTPSVLTGYCSGEAGRGTMVRPAPTDETEIITLEWTPCPDEDFLSYILCREASEGSSGPGEVPPGILVTTDPDCTSFEDLDVVWGTTYTYSLMTLNDQELASWSNEVFLTPSGTPPTASELDVNMALPGWIELEWTPCPDSDFHSYSLYRSTLPDIHLDPGSAERLATMIGVHSVAYVDDDALYDTPLYYAVLTQNSKGLTSWSNEVTAVSEMPPFPWDPIYRRYLNSPEEACFLPAGDLLYVAKHRYNMVKVLETEDYTILASIPVDDEPNGIACSPDGGFVYVCSHSGTLTTIDTGTQSIVRETALPPFCTDVVCPPPGDRLYVIAPGNGYLLALDAVSGVIEDTLHLPGIPGDLAFSPDGGTLFITDRSRRRLIFVEPAGLSIQREVTLFNVPEGLAVSDANLVYCSMMNGELCVVEGRWGEVLHLYSPGIHGYGLAVLPGTELLYLTSETEDRVQVLEGSTGECLGIREEGNPTGVVCRPDGSQVLVLSEPSGEIVVLEFPE